MHLPFRADHVGSLLRPPELLRARAEHQAGRLSAEEIAPHRGRGDPRCRADAGGDRPPRGHRRRVPPRLLAHGFSLPDRRRRQDRPGLRIQFRNEAGPVEAALGAFRIGGKLSLDKTIFAEDFAYLKSVAPAGTVPKLTIPSPSMLHYRGGRAVIDRAAYPDMEAFWHDLAEVYKKEIAGLAALGCTYLQLDDTSLAYLNDPAQRAYVEQHRRRRRAPAPDQHPPDQPGARRQAGGHDRVHAYVPRQFPLVLGGRGRLRPCRRGAVRRARGRRLLSRIRRCPLGRVRAVALRAQGATSGSCSASSPASGRRSKARTS